MIRKQIGTIVIIVGMLPKLYALEKIEDATENRVNHLMQESGEIPVLHQGDPGIMRTTLIPLPLNNNNREEGIPVAVLMEPVMIDGEPEYHEATNDLQNTYPSTQQNGILTGNKRTHAVMHESHELLHESSQELCADRMSDHNERLSHTHKRFAGTKEYFCRFPGCSHTAFKTPSGLRKHRQNKHEVKRYHCYMSGCTHVFKHKKELMHHVDSMHPTHTRVQPEQPRNALFSSLLATILDRSAIETALASAHEMNDVLKNQLRRLISNKIENVDDADDEIGSAIASTTSSAIDSAVESDIKEEITPGECAICLASFEVDESFSTLLQCMHNKRFHKICVEQWLAGHTSCPLCRVISRAIGAQELTEEQRALLKAARYGDKRTVERLFQEGVSVDIADDLGDTPLMMAVRNGHGKLVEFFLSRGADIERFNRNNKSNPLLSACGRYNEGMVKLLLAHGAQPHAVNELGNTPLLVATRFNNKASLRLLLEQGAEVNITNRDGHTPLQVAAYYGYDEIVSLLLAHGAAIEQRIEDGLITPLMLAAERNHPAVIKILVTAGANIEAQDSDGDTALIRAASNNAVQAIKALLLLGAEKATINTQKETALMIAIFQKYTDIIVLLLEQ